jgi:iron-sulfur cluster repair protein YtfE (RIC family)
MIKQAENEMMCQIKNDDLAKIGEHVITKYANKYRLQSDEIIALKNPVSRLKVKQSDIPLELLYNN